VKMLVGLSITSSSHWRNMSLQEVRIIDNVSGVFICRHYSRYVGSCESLLASFLKFDSHWRLGGYGVALLVMWLMILVVCGNVMMKIVCDLIWHQH
jgi:hypothetical protein